MNLIDEVLRSLKDNIFTEAFIGQLSGKKENETKQFRVLVVCNALRRTQLPKAIVSVGRRFFVILR